MSDNREVEVSVDFITHTDMAVLVTDGGERDAVWLPKSLISDVDYTDTRPDAEDWDDLVRGDTITVTIPEWLALDRGLI
jgi:hypothetical protein